MENQPALIEKRELYEAQNVHVLIGHRALLLSRMSDLEAEIHLINDVMSGMGHEETIE